MRKTLEQRYINIRMSATLANINPTLNSGCKCQHDYNITDQVGLRLQCQHDYNVILVLVLVFFRRLCSRWFQVVPGGTPLWVRLRLPQLVDSSNEFPPDKAPIYIYYNPTLLYFILTSYITLISL